MAVCGFCDQEMTEKVGCTLPVYDDLVDGITWQRLPFNDVYPSCGDCGCPRRTLHHPGCDMERCPRCHGQAISCGCAIEWDEVLAEGDDFDVFL